MLSQEQAAYLAGVIDGEGCITASGFNSLRVQVANTNREWLETLRQWCGGGGCVTQHRGRFNKRPSYSWALSVRQSQEVVGQCLPYLMLKKQQAGLFVQWIDLRASYAATIRQGFPIHPEYRAGVMAIRERLRELNKRGVHGQPYPGSPKTDRRCSLEACDRPHHSNGYCKQHHKKYIERGGPKWHEQNCERCGRPFVAKRSDARFCSRGCTFGDYYAAHKDAYLARAKASRERKRLAKT